MKFIWKLHDVLFIALRSEFFFKSIFPMHKKCQMPKSFRGLQQWSEFNEIDAIFLFCSFIIIHTIFMCTLHIQLAIDSLKIWLILICI